ncbi:MAG: FtsH protease activity modulator HflK [Parvularculaceae bacterium]|nr:FtsH protease activity modulator HflK [Parvularculaceae bacterium]
MPWTDKPNGSNNGPWGRPQNNGGGGSNGGGNGRGGGGGAPDLEELLRSGRERFGGGRGGSGGDGQPINLPQGPIMIAILIGIAALWIFSGVYQVQPGERGVVTTFGKFSSLTDPGLNWHIPFPVQEVRTVDVADQRSVSIAATGRRPSMLTSDLNIVDVGLDVNYRVASDATWNPESGELPNAAKFVFAIENPDATVRATAEAALREVVGANKFEPITSRGRSIVNDRTAEILQQTLDSYGSGIEVVRVNFGKAEPPAQVVPAQRDVIDATSDAAQKVNVAQGFANSEIPRAQGDARQLVLQAEGYAAAVVSEAKGDAARFISILSEYEKAPEVTRQRMYLETMEGVLGDMNKVVIDDDAGGTLPYLNINELARDAQRQAVRRSQEGGNQ